MVRIKGIIILNVRKSAFFAILGEIVIRGLGLISVVLIARLLTPDELGVFAIAGSVVFIAAEFRSMGAGNFLIKEKEIDNGKLRKVLGSGIIVSWSLGLTILLFSSFIADYYSIAALGNMLALLSISFFLTPFVTVPSACLARELKFDSLFFVNSTKQIVSLIVVVVTALAGESYFSLVYGQLAGTVVEITLFVSLYNKYFIYRPSFLNLRGIFKFGLYVAGANMLNRLNLVISDLIIGKKLTTRDVAIYSRGVGFLDFITSTTTMGLRAIILPYLSKINRRSEDLTLPYIRASNIMASLLWPILVVSAIASYPIVLLMFGNQWIDTVPFIPYLALSVLLRSIHALSLEVFIICNREKVLFYKVLTIFLSTTILILLSISQGLLAVSQAMVFVGLFDFILTSWLLQKYIKIKMIDFNKAILPNIILTSSCGGATYLLSVFIDFKSGDNLQILFIVALVNLPIWAITCFILKLEIFEELLIFFKTFLSKKTSKNIG